jgi:hypothetical protein
MDPNTAEVLEVEEEPVVEEATDDELLGAIDEELSEPEPVDEAEPEVEVEAEVPDEEGAVDEVEAEPESEKEPEPEPEVEAKEEKPSDEFGTLEDSVPEKTRERFEAVKQKYDEIIAQRDQVTQEFETLKSDADTWRGAIMDTGTTPEQFGMALTWLKKINSKDPSDLEDAYAIMSKELETIGRAIGRPAPGVYNPIDEYPDLKERVDDGLMDESSALEVAQARAAQRLRQNTRQQQDTAQQEQAAVHAALEDVKRLGEQLKASDPQFDAKMEYLAPIIEAAVKSGARPEKWVPMIQDAYAKLPSPRVAPSKPKPTAPNPIRPTGASPSTSTMEREPGNEMEALNQALERGF